MINVGFISKGQPDLFLKHKKEKLEDKIVFGNHLILFMRFLYCPLPASAFWSKSSVSKWQTGETWSFSVSQVHSGFTSFATKNYLLIVSPRCRNSNLEVGWRTDTEAGCKYNRLGSTYSILEKRIHPVRHVPPCFLRSQEALNILKFSNFVC